MSLPFECTATPAPPSQEFEATRTCEQACAAAATVDGRTIDGVGGDGPTITAGGVERPTWPAAGGDAAVPTPASEIMATASTEDMEVPHRREPAATTSPPAALRDTSFTAVRLPASQVRSEEHTSELQSRQYLVCR